MSSLLYLELCDSRGYVTTQRALVDEDMIVQLAAVVSADEEYDEIVSETTEEHEELEKMYAFYTFMVGDWNCDTVEQRASRWKKIWKALDSKGFYAEEWEEGSFGICLPDAKPKLVDAIARIEARVQKNNWYF